MNDVENERTEILCVRVLRQYNYMVRSLHVTLVLLIVTPRIGVNYTNKQSHIISVLSLVFNITIPYITPAVSTRNLGVNFDKFNFREHTSQTC